MINTDSAYQLIYVVAFHVSVGMIMMHQSLMLLLLSLMLINMILEGMIVTQVSLSCLLDCMISWQCSLNFAMITMGQA